MQTNPAARLTVEECEAYQALCAFCSWALYGDADPAAVRAMAAERQMFLEPPFSQVAPQAAAALADALAACAQDGPAGQAALAALKQDRSYLFYMVGASHTSPYESVYRTDDMTMFGPQTMAVRAAYRARGLAFDHAATEPDDHVGLEFSFCAHLLARAAEGDAAALDDLRAFLSEHLLVFGPIYLRNLETRARSAFFSAVAGVARGALASLAEALDARPVETLDEGRFLLA